MRPHRLVLGLALAIVAAVAVPSGASTRGTTVERTVTTDAGTMRYLVHTPPGAAPAAAEGTEPRLPLVIALHGSGSSAADTARQTGWDDLADELGLVVAYPEGPGGSWTWGEAVRLGRADAGASLVAEVTRAVTAEFGTDPDRVLISGISQGAGMASAVALSHPELYAAVGLESGCGFSVLACYPPPGCAPACEDAPWTPALTGEQSAAAAFAAMGERARRLPAIVSAGDVDPIAIAVGQEALVTQWTGVHDRVDDGEADGSVPGTPASAQRGHAGRTTFEREVYDDADGCPVLERWTIRGLGHAHSGQREDDGATGIGPDLRRQQVRFLLHQTSRVREGTC